jgi:hypothetical protein
MNQKSQALINTNLMIGIDTPNKNTAFNLDQTRKLLQVIALGTGEELLTKCDLRAIGAHPFSDSTRRRKIKDGQYPPPLMLSSQMPVWRVASIRFFLIDPLTYKARIAKFGESK